MTVLNKTKVSNGRYSTATASQFYLPILSAD